MSSEWQELERPADVRELRLSWDKSGSGGPGFNLSLTLERSDGTVVEASFTNVTAFHVDQAMADLPVVLMVYDHRPDGWESHSQLKVADAEQDRRLSFYCSSICVRARA